MNLTPAQQLLATIRLPVWLLSLALLAGVLLAAGSLSYAPEGRINVLWLWLLWAGLPLLGALVSLWVALFGRSRPWLFQWRQREYHWYPTTDQRLHMLWLLQYLWAVAGLGMLLGFWVMLLSTDLAFGWSSTLIDDEQRLLTLMGALAWPWHGLWPSAVPDAGLLEATRYIRIEPAASTARAGDWWPFMMASLLCYNLIPRLLLGLALQVRWRLARREKLVINAPESRLNQTQDQSVLSEASLADWLDSVRVTWELDQANTCGFGLKPWVEDEQAMEKLLRQAPEKLLWEVNANRSPVAELGDLIDKARAAGVAQQAILAVGDEDTDPERHMASWRGFARRQKLVWVTADV